MKIGIISDTHDQVHHVMHAVEIFKGENVGKVYHLGDWCSPFVPGLFKVLNCEVISIWGNNDADIYKLITNKPGNVEFKDRFFTETLEGKKIALFHGDPEALVQSLVASRVYDIVLRGHNHIAEIQQQGSTTIINPGNLVGPFGDKQQWTPPSIAIYDFATNQARIIELT